MKAKHIFDLIEDYDVIEKGCAQFTLDFHDKCGETLVGESREKDILLDLRYRCAIVLEVIREGTADHEFFTYVYGLCDRALEPS